MWPGWRAYLAGTRALTTVPMVLADLRHGFEWWARDARLGRALSAAAPVLAMALAVWVLSCVAIAVMAS